MHAVPQQRFRIDWVLVDELAIGPAPRAPRHLDRLADAGIHAVFSVCGQEEAPPPQDLGRRFAHQRLVLPDHRSGRLPQVSELQTALQQLLSLHQQHKQCLVGSNAKKCLKKHCRAHNTVKIDFRAVCTHQALFVLQVQAQSW